MIFLKKIKLNITSIIIIILLIIFSINAIRNTIAANANFYISNISIREIFLLDNDPKFKGTHEPSRRFFNLINENYSMIKEFNSKELNNKFKKIKNLDISKTSYFVEENLLKIFVKLSKLPIKEKKISGLFIPKDITSYWNLSCDIYMPPFIAPAITNIVLLNALPDNSLDSCYGHSREYGYARYFEYKKYFDSSILTKNSMCKEVQKEGLQKAIVIRQKNKNFFEIKTHDCLEN